jgi:hypothetical protein
MIDETTVAASVAMLVHRELAEDGVGLWALPWHIRRALPEAGDRQVREIAAAVLEALVAAGAAIGSLDETTGTFTPWETQGAAESAMAAWQALGRDPNIGEVAWIARTP